MGKKQGFLILSVFAILGAVFFFLKDPGVNTFTSADCPFCNSTIVDSQKFYEDDEVVAMCTYKPTMPGHCLVIPKRHVERFEMLSEIEITHIGRVIRKVNTAAQRAFGTSSYLLLQKNGQAAGQTVPHVHFHYMPRMEGDNSMVGLIFRMGIANFQRPISPMALQKAVNTMKEEMKTIPPTTKDSQF